MYGYCHISMFAVSLAELQVNNRLMRVILGQVCEKDAKSRNTTFVSEIASVIYASTANDRFDIASLQALEQRAQAHNFDVRITGYLSYRNERFTQFLEGPQEHVASLMTRIRADGRHDVTTEVALSMPPGRQFPNWSMRLLNPLWLPSGNSFDAIDEVLQLSGGHTETDSTAAALERLVAEAAKDSRYWS